MSLSTPVPGPYTFLYNHYVHTSFLKPIGTSKLNIMLNPHGNEELTSYMTTMVATPICGKIYKQFLGPKIL